MEWVELVKSSSSSSCAQSWSHRVGTDCGSRVIMRLDTGSRAAAQEEAIMRMMMRSATPVQRCSSGKPRMMSGLQELDAVALTMSVK